MDSGNNTFALPPSQQTPVPIHYCTICKICGEFRLNFQIFHPFISLSSHDYRVQSILLKPSNGNFASYKFGEDLHIGLSLNNSVYSFWSHGIMLEGANRWMNAIYVYKFNRQQNIAVLLQRFLDDQYLLFAPKSYDATNWNCFDFIIEFLRFIRENDICSLSSLINKDDFISEYVRPSLKRVRRYLFLVDRLAKSPNTIIAINYASWCH